MRHGLATSGAAFAALLPQGAASANVPSSLVTSTAKAASLFAAGQAAAAVVPTEVAALAEEVLKTMLLIKLKIGAGLLLSVAALVIGAYGLTSPSLQAEPAVVKEPLHAKTEEPPAAVEQGRVQGQFTAADTGMPVAGAKVWVLVQGVPGKAAVVEGVSDADGRYAVKVPFGDCRL